MGEGVGQVNLVNDFLLPLKKNGELFSFVDAIQCVYSSKPTKQIFAAGSVTLLTRYLLWSTVRLSLYRSVTLLTHYLLWSTVRLSLYRSVTLLTRRDADLSLFWPPFCFPVAAFT